MGPLNSRGPGTATPPCVISSWPLSASRAAASLTAGICLLQSLSPPPVPLPLFSPRSILRGTSLGQQVVPGLRERRRERIGLGGLRRGRGRGRDRRGRGARALIACFLRRAAAPLLDRFLSRGFRCIDIASGPLRRHLDFKVQAEEEPREPSIEKKKQKKTLLLVDSPRRRLFVFSLLSIS